MQSTCVCPLPIQRRVKAKIQVAGPEEVPLYTERPSLRDTHSHHNPWRRYQMRGNMYMQRNRWSAIPWNTTALYGYAHALDPPSSHRTDSSSCLWTDSTSSHWTNSTNNNWGAWMGPEVLLRLSIRRATFTKHILTTDETKTKEYHKLEGIQVSSRKSEKQASRKDGSRARTGDGDRRQARRSCQTGT
jgi:hypothetical protein